MDNLERHSIIDNMIFPALAFLIPSIPILTAHFTIGVKTYLFALGEMGLCAFISLIIILAVLPISLQKPSPTGSIICGTVASILLVIYCFWMILAARARHESVLYDHFSPVPITNEHFIKMAKRLKNSNKPIIMSSFINFELLFIMLLFIHIFVSSYRIKALLNTQ